MRKGKLGGQKRDTRDFYNYYCANKPAGKQWIVKEKLYGEIIRCIHKHMIDHILATGSFKLPGRSGCFDLAKKIYKPWIKNGKLINHRCVDWGATSKLWEEDPESKKQKVLIKYENNTIFLIKYCNVQKAYFTNCYYYRLYSSLYFKRQIKKAARTGNLEGYTIYDATKRKHQGDNITY